MKNESLRSLVDYDGGSDFFFLLDFRVSDGDGIGEENGASVFSSRVVRQHNFDFDSHNSLFEEDVADGDVDIVVAGLTGVNHISIYHLFYPWLNFMDLALYCWSFPEMMTWQPLAPSLMTPLMMELAAILTGTWLNSLNLQASAWALAHNPLFWIFTIDSSTASLG